MKLLIFSHTPLTIQGYTRTYGYMGGNWITEFIDLMKIVPHIELGVCFINNEFKNEKIRLENITYYLISESSNIINKIYLKFSKKLKNCINSSLEIVYDFKPDIIHIFGTESGFGLITPFIKVPVIIHMQGLLNPYYENFYPSKVSENLLKRTHTIKERIFLNGAYNNYMMLSKLAEREIDIIKQNINYFIRNKWTQDYIKLINKNAKFYYCQEIIREPFYEFCWELKPRSNKTIVSVFNGEPYKGWDYIIKTAKVLKKFSNLDFNWKIIGVTETNPLINLFEKNHQAKFHDMNIEFLGKKSSIDMINIMLNADLFVHLSHNDNSPNSVSEAMILGMPVICNNVGGCDELIEDGTNGFIIKENDPYMTANLILKLLTDNETLFNISQNARQIARKRHDRQDILNCVLDSYYLLLQKL